MANKPFHNKSFLDIYRSTQLDYPPKDKQIYRAGNFLAGEHFNKENYQQLPLGQGEDRCAGRVLRPEQQVTWACGEQLEEGESKTYQTKVSGAVGGVTYTMDPFWSEVNDNGDLAVIDSNGVVTLEENTCQGPYPPWIIYFVCDDCGCSQGTIWLEDCSVDCDACADADCGLPTVTGTITIGPDTTGQYTFNNPQGDVLWAISGSGFSIDQTGLVTTSSACGTATITVTDSCCGDYTLDIKSTIGSWSLIESLNGQAKATSPCTLIDGCTESGTGSQDCFEGVFWWEITYRQTMYGSRSGCTDCSGCGWVRTDPPLPGCFVPGIENANHCFWYARSTLKYAWVCA